MANAIFKALVPACPTIPLVVDTLMHRTGRKVFAALWGHDGCVSGPNQIRFGYCFVIVGIVVTLPFCNSPVRRTVPLGFVCQSLLWLCYASRLHDDAVVADRRWRAPWYLTKQTTSTADLLITARRALIAARFLPGQPNQPTPAEIRQVQQAWAPAAA